MPHEPPGRMSQGGHSLHLAHSAGPVTTGSWSQQKHGAQAHTTPPHPHSSLPGNTTEDMEAPETSWSICSLPRVGQYCQALGASLPRPAPSFCRPPKSQGGPAIYKEKLASQASVPPTLASSVGSGAWLDQDSHPSYTPSSYTPCGYHITEEET